MALVASAVLASGDIVKGIGMVVVGLLLGLVGADVNSGTPRYTFGVLELYDGIGFTVIVVGLFAVTEVVGNLESKDLREVFTRKIAGLMPTRKDIKDSAWPTVRGTAIGSVFGVLLAFAGGAGLGFFTLIIAYFVGLLTGRATLRAAGYHRAEATAWIAAAGAGWAYVCSGIVIAASVGGDARAYVQVIGLLVAGFFAYREVS